MGIVYRAHDPELQREVAIKELLVLPGEAGAQSEESRERFFREARAAARLSHPGIAGVYDILREGEKAYIVMEYVKGGSLSDAFQRGDLPDQASIFRVIREAAAALDSAHAAGIVHRDIKPGNILLDEQGRVKIVDFGIAKLSSSQTLTQPGASVGTIGYMAPEQVRGQEVRGQADQFSLAVVAYQLLTGRLPFEADSWISLSYKILHEQPGGLDQLPKEVGEGPSRALLRGLGKDASDRYPTCSEFAAALAGEPDAAPPRRPRPRSRAALAAGVAAILAAAGGVAWYLVSRDRPAPVPPPLTVTGTPKPAEAAPPKPPTVDPNGLTAQRAGVTFEFATIPSGQFMMGSDSGDEEERPRHMVRVSRGFQMGKHEVTRRQWAAITGGPAGDDLPANASFNSALAFIAKLNAAGDGFRYRLPTEAEWEYAARAGSQENVLSRLDDIAWYSGNSGYKAQPVSQRLPNAWGLSDMVGNVWEWVADWYEPGYYANSPKADPAGPPAGKLRVLRGGSFNTQPMMLRLTYRAAREPGDQWEEAGFRLVRQPATPTP